MAMVMPQPVGPPRGPRSVAADALILAATGAVLYTLLAVAPKELHRVSASVTIDLRPGALPGYSLLSLLRMIAAYALSLAFTLVAGYAATRSPSSVIL